MDIRSFKNDVCQCNPGFELEKMFELQELLLEKYLSIEGLPHWPIDINSREGQSVVKDMSARIIEELGEGYESTTYALQMLDKIGFNFNSKWTREDYRMLLNHLQNSNEEQADAIAFAINLLLYSNIYPEDIHNYIESKYKVFYRYEHDLTSMMEAGLLILISRFSDIPDNHHKWDIFNNGLFDVFNIKDYEAVASYTPAFQKISWESHDIEAKICWEISYHLSVARNYLKNKPWKQTGEITDELRYQEEVVIAFIELLGYFKFIGMTPQSLLQLRYKKHLVNEFRITSKY